MNLKNNNGQFDKIDKDLEKIYAILNVQGAALVEAQSDIKEIKNVNEVILDQTSASELGKVYEKITFELMVEFERFNISMFNQLREDLSKDEKEIRTNLLDGLTYINTKLDKILDKIK